MERSTTRSPVRPPRWSWLAGLLAVALVAIGTLVVITFVLDDGDSAGPERGATVREVTSDPADYLGEVVTVSGQVQNAIPGGFVLGQETDARLLVVYAHEVGTGGLGADEAARVTGVVQQVHRVDPELISPRALGVLSEFEGEPMIIASRVRLLPGRDELEDSPGLDAPE
jgi:hypothetical protein